MEKNEHLNALAKGLKSTGFSMTFDLNFYSNAKKAVDEGFKVFLFDPLEKPVTYGPSDGINMVPSLATYLNVKLEKTQRKALYTPWHGLYANCPDLPWHLENETDTYERKKYEFYIAADPVNMFES
ncbi:uncharacterized protein LOC129226885 [Uloborus diversus]|uniref:uncharacterized protein LOC129226885 n=1 Tax=Uloborus diversus TaxID=327109 RepID=UPI00240A25F6|nr:uncharacterized protein LOC129226885 [Uloborus diversus]